MNLMERFANAFLKCSKGTTEPMKNVVEKRDYLGKKTMAAT